MAEEHNHSRQDRGHSEGSRSGDSHSRFRGKGGYRGRGSSSSRSGGFHSGSRSGGFRRQRSGHNYDRGDHQGGQEQDRRGTDRRGQYRHYERNQQDEEGRRSRRNPADGSPSSSFKGRHGDRNNRSGYGHKGGYDRRHEDKTTHEEGGGYRSGSHQHGGFRRDSGSARRFGPSRSRRTPDRGQRYEQDYRQHDDRHGNARPVNGRRPYSDAGSRSDRRNDQPGRRGYSSPYKDRRSHYGDDRRDAGSRYAHHDGQHGVDSGERRQDRTRSQGHKSGFNRSANQAAREGFEHKDNRGRDRRYEQGRDRGNNHRGLYQRDRQGGYEKASRNSDGTISYPSQNPYTDRRPGEPKMPKGMDWSMLSKDERERLRGLSKEHAENIGLHILAAYALEEDDPQGALAHAKWAAKQASRIDLARETLALVSYRQGDYKLALKEFRTAYRMNGYQDYLPFIADCERGLGHPRKAIEEATSEEAKDLTGESKVEMFLVYAGALGDLGLWDKAIETVQALVKARGLSGDYRMRAVQAEQNFLDQAGRSQEALDLEPLLERLEAQYADEDDDPDDSSREILIDYDLEHLDDSMMEELSIDPDESDSGEDNNQEIDETLNPEQDKGSNQETAFVWGRDTVRPERIPAEEGWIPSPVAKTGIRFDQTSSTATDTTPGAHQESDQQVTPSKEEDEDGAKHPGEDQPQED